MYCFLTQGANPCTKATLRHHPFLDDTFSQAPSVCRANTPADDFHSKRVLYFSSPFLLRNGGWFFSIPPVFHAPSLSGFYEISAQKPAERRHWQDSAVLHEVRRALASLTAHLRKGLKRGFATAPFMEHEGQLHLRSACPQDFLAAKLVACPMGLSPLVTAWRLIKAFCSDE